MGIKKNDDDETQVNFKCKVGEKKQMEALATQFGFVSLSEYLRFLGLNAVVKVTAHKAIK